MSKGFLSIKEEVDSMGTDIGNELVHKGEDLVNMGSQFLVKGGMKCSLPAHATGPDYNQMINTERAQTKRIKLMHVQHHTL